MTPINKFEQEKHQHICRLLHQAQASSHRSQQESIINQIVVIILRSRPLCRRFNGTSLIGVYLNIYEEVKTKLLDYIQRYLYTSENSVRQKESLICKELEPIHLYALQNQFFKETLDDKNLKKLGLTAKKYPLNSELRTYALTELVKAIKLSGKVCRPHAQKFSFNLYQTLYEEALTETFAYICLNIDLYDQNRGNKKFMNWVNYKLNKQILKCYERYTKNAQYEILSFRDLEQIRQPENTPDLSQLLRDYISQDPDKMFSNVHIRNRPDASFAQISLAKFSGKSWEEISHQYDIPVPTLSSFYNRWCRRFAPFLETELKKYF